MGPTNSGKTYQALNRLKGVSSGVYCGPLRLLAAEVAERLNAEGTVCSLVTGQELDERPDATVVSCTTEMVDTSRFYDAAVIDEIQVRWPPHTHAHTQTHAHTHTHAASPSAFFLYNKLFFYISTQIYIYALWFPMSSLFPLFPVCATAAGRPRPRLGVDTGDAGCSCEGGARVRRARGVGSVGAALRNDRRGVGGECVCVPAFIARVPIKTQGTHVIEEGMQPPNISMG